MPRRKNAFVTMPCGEARRHDAFVPRREYTPGLQLRADAHHQLLPWQVGNQWLHLRVLLR